MFPYLLFYLEKGFKPVSLKIDSQGIAIDNRLLCKDINLHFKPGQFWAIVGPNGSGKTSLLHTLSGLREAKQSKILLEDKPIQKYRYKQRAKKLGVLLQEQELNQLGTVYEALMAARYPFQDAWLNTSNSEKGIIDDALSSMEIIQFKHRTIATLSGGEQQRLQIAMLLTQNPDIYILDEPTNHLDLKYQINALQKLKQLAIEEQKIIITVVHDINLAYRYADSACLLFADGKVMSGKLDDVFTEKNLSALFETSLKKVAVDNRVIWIAE